MRRCAAIAVAWIALAGATGAVADPTASAGRPSPAAPPPATPSPDGKSLYVAKCGACHLERGTGTFMLDRRYGKDEALLENRTDLGSAGIASAVRHGTGSMPHLTRIEVSDDDLRTITAWLMRPAAQRNSH